MAKFKCPYGECKHFKNGRCTKEEEISKLSMEEIIKAMKTNVCKFREEKIKRR